MSAVENVADVLDAAADLLEKPGAWTTRTCARDRQGNTTGWDEDDAECFCALGAIFRAGKGDVSGADDFFGKALGGLGWGSIAPFNDAPGRTQDEVVAKLREAAALARQEQAA
jgi:hypothetical protein